MNTFALFESHYYLHSHRPSWYNTQLILPLSSPKRFQKMQGFRSKIMHMKFRVHLPQTQFQFILSNNFNCLSTILENVLHPISLNCTYKYISYNVRWIPTVRSTVIQCICDHAFLYSSWPSSWKSVLFFLFASSSSLSSNPVTRTYPKTNSGDIANSICSVFAWMDGWMDGWIDRMVEWVHEWWFILYWQSGHENCESVDVPRKVCTLHAAYHT